jgi:DNA polymerase III sliding clamp (beta) subunit (PCNA family)
MQVNKTKLQKALGYVSPGLASKEVIQQATAFVFMDGVIMTYNDRISISHPMEELKGLTGAIQADELYKLLNKVKREEIDIIINENEAVIKSGKMKAGFTLQSEIKLPFESIGKKGKWKVISGEMVKAMMFTAMACSEDMSRPELTGIHLNQGGIEATDNHRIVRYTIESMEAMDIDIIIPANAAMEISKLSPVKIAKGEGWIHFKTDEGTVISSRIIEAKYCDLSPFMKVKGHSLEFPKKIIDIIDRAVIFSKRDHVLDEEIDVGIDNNQLSVSSKSGTSWFEEKTNINYEGSPIIFTIIPYVLRDILTKTLTCIVGDTRLKFSGDNWIYITDMMNKE